MGDIPTDADFLNEGLGFDSVAYNSDYSRKYRLKSRGLWEKKCLWCGRYLLIGVDDYHPTCLAVKNRISK